MIQIIMGNTYESNYKWDKCVIHMRQITMGNTYESNY